MSEEDLTPIEPDEDLTPPIEEEDDPIPPVDEEEETAEIRAARMGWKPEEEFKGTGEWVDAEEFLTNTDNDPVQLKKSLRTMTRNYSKLEKGVDAILAHQDRQVEDARQTAREEANAENEARFNQAMEDGDSETAQELYKQRGQEPQAQDGTDARVVAWRKEQPWMDTDPVMSDAANRYADSLMAQGESIETMLTKTTEYMKKHFPDEFPGERKAPRQVNGSNRNSVVVKHKAKPGTYEALNQASRTQCDAFARNMKSKGFTEEKARANFMEYTTEDMFN